MQADLGFDVHMEKRDCCAVKMSVKKGSLLFNTDLFFNWMRFTFLNIIIICLELTSRETCSKNIKISSFIVNENT